MKTIIAGSRTITNINILQEALKEIDWKITEIVCGKAKGVDYLGEVYARDFGIPIKYFPANWNLYGKSAGPIRNKQMAEYADAAIIIWDGISKGSLNMIKTAEKLGLKIYIKNLLKEKGEAS